MVVHFASTQDLDPRLAYGSLFARAGAFPVDAMIVAALILVFREFAALATHSALFPESAGPGPAASPIRRMILFSGYINVPAAYFIGFETSRRQATPGKAMLGLIVVDDYGLILKSKGAARRLVFLALNIFILNLGSLSMLFDKRRRGLHDRLSGAYVIQLPIGDRRAVFANLIAIGAAAGLALWLVSPPSGGAAELAAAQAKVPADLRLFWEHMNNSGSLMGSVGAVAESEALPSSAGTEPRPTKKAPPELRGGMLIF